MKLLKGMIPVITGFTVILLSVYSISAIQASANAVRLPVEFGQESEIDSFQAASASDESDRPETGNTLSAATIDTLKIVHYEVKKGDSLALIAKKFALNMDTIVSFNKIKSVRNIVAGLVLDIPNSNGISHKVGKGDCLSCIASRYKVPLNKILDWNDLKSDTIAAGTSLFIPGAKLSRTELNKVLGKLFVWPVKGQLSSTYGYRIHPIDGTKSFHNGLDIAGKVGTSIKAAIAGKVAKVGKNFLYGNYVIMSHDDGYQSLYGHLSAVTTKEGRYLEQGMEVGKMGNTGYSTGDHLHFSIFRNGDTVDPMKYLNGSS